MLETTILQHWLFFFFFFCLNVAFYCDVCPEWFFNYFLIVYSLGLWGPAKATWKKTRRWHIEFYRCLGRFLDMKKKKKKANKNILLVMLFLIFSALPLRCGTKDAKLKSPVENPELWTSLCFEAWGKTEYICQASSVYDQEFCLCDSFPTGSPPLGQYVRFMFFVT